MTIDLQQFCSTDPMRPYIHKPFSRGDFSYATNGHLCIRVPRMAEYAEQEKPDTDALFSKYFKPAVRGPIEVVLPAQQAPSLECETCEGRGHEHDCPNCGCPCRTCDGVGMVEPPSPKVGIGVALFNAKYIRKLMALPNFCIEQNPPQIDAASFSFDGGDGLLMPIRGGEADVMAKVTLPCAA